MERKIIINTTKDFVELKEYLDRYCDRYNFYYDLPLYGPVVMGDKTGFKWKPGWFIDPFGSESSRQEEPQSPTVSFEELYKKDVITIGPQ